MKKYWNFKAVAIAALIAASSGAYFYLSVQATQSVGGNETLELPETGMIPAIEKVEEEQHKVLPDVKLMARIAKIGRRLIPH